ncbi:Rieske 2Fe-2S domain-containing protein [Pigmentiphaga sp.]|uniref:Rieske 2Fe-2S domain-containing protein n=1 Tax=Pigmentiphaga sp. TaxID=1977564 RepID=UPI00128E31DF|nr:Rieske 2Fe-2S domain-containing protein [Pigmentiphaga sp.]MPS25449.1 aromatic ring-hydroxylating dioxygenase subunit alpha [Alcaligenaceae bacterium SAGV5]MPS54063.1 aromatic ring-hydroxylating dioxygenase subunit alpha [Alcaligenaceae bacterium SAGV3]MPT58762.1 aromatic ring-hydroxylating dioxygenase subunit alpha [Alcaligenaceae bacterium]
MLSLEMNRMLTRVEKGAPMGNLIGRFWMPALLSEEIAEPDGPPVRVGLLGHRLVAFRDSEGRVGLLDARCPHRSVDLFFGRNEQGGLRCVYHGWKFGVDGACVDMPSEPPSSPMKAKVRARAYPVHESGGIIWAYLGPGEAPAVPDIEFMSLPESHVYASKRLMRCNYMQALEGSLDTSHLTFLHQMNRMSKDVFGVGDFQRFSDADGAPRFFCADTSYGMSISARRDGDDDTYYWRVTQWLMPVGVLVPTAPGNVCRANFFVPIDDRNCWWYRIRYQPERPLEQGEIEEYDAGDLDYSRRVPGTYESMGNQENDYLIDRGKQRTESFTGIPSAQLQDIAVQESQGEIADRSIEHLGTSDTAIAQTRRRLINAAQALEEGHSPQEARAASQYRIRAIAIALNRSRTFDEAAALAHLPPA